MSKVNNIKRAQRIRSKLKKVNTERFRLTVFRPARNISAQIIDDQNNKTLLSASSAKEIGSNKKKTELSKIVAETLSKKAVIKNMVTELANSKINKRIQSFIEKYLIKLL